MAQLQPTHKPPVPQQMPIHRAVDPRQVQPRHPQVFHLFPHLSCFPLFVFHVSSFKSEICSVCFAGQSSSRPLKKSSSTATLGCVHLVRAMFSVREQRAYKKKKPRRNRGALLNTSNRTRVVTALSRSKSV